VVFWGGGGWGGVVGGGGGGGEKFLVFLGGGGGCLVGVWWGCFCFVFLGVFGVGKRGELRGPGEFQRALNI